LDLRELSVVFGIIACLIENTWLSIELRSFVAGLKDNGKERKRETGTDVL